MTIDDLINKLRRLKREHGGDIPVKTIYDGQPGLIEDSEVFYSEVINAVVLLQS